MIHPGCTHTSACPALEERNQVGNLLPIHGALQAIRHQGLTDDLQTHHLIPGQGFLDPLGLPERDDRGSLARQ